MPPETKTCPFCAETIKYAAVVCRFCGRDLGGPSGNAARAANLRNCPDCGATGRTKKDCPCCGGTGREDCPSCYNGLTYEDRRCSRCGGSGYGGSCTCCAGRGYDEESCTTCGGSGQLTFDAYEEVLRQRAREEARLKEEEARKAAEANQARAAAHAKAEADKVRRQAEAERQRAAQAEYEAESEKRAAETARLNRQAEARGRSLRVRAYLFALAGVISVLAPFLRVKDSVPGNVLVFIMLCMGPVGLIGCMMMDDDNKQPVKAPEAVTATGLWTGGCGTIILILAIIGYLMNR